MRRCYRTFLLLLGACAAAPGEPAPALRPVAADLRPYVRRHLRELAIPAVGLAVLDVDPLSGAPRLWVEEFGDAAPESVYRVASISKLFTATAAMVLVERGALDLDAPVERYLPEFAPHNPYDAGITLRDLLGHRAGIVREGPVGHYFDPTEPSLAATVASLNGTALVHAPGTAFKYSNPGLGVVGEVVARTAGTPFEEAARALVLGPLDLGDSDFAARPDLVARQARGVMWTYDGREIPTPDFQFGYGPAANLRATVRDLVTFAGSWFPGSERRVLTREGQLRMWQLPPGATRGCGLGFFVEPFEGHRMVGHDGLAYGFASCLLALPDAGLAVAVVCTRDFAWAVPGDIAQRALRAALASRRGEALPPPEFPRPLGAARARALAGHWRCGLDWVELYERGGELYYDPNIGVRTRLRLRSDGRLVADDPLAIGSRVLRETEGGRLRDCEDDPATEQEYVRDASVPPPCPEELAPYLGEYGWDHDVLVVYEDRGDLGVLIEWVVRDLPEPVGPDCFRFRPGMYGGDLLRFERDEENRVVAAVVGGARFVRRPGPDPAGFRIEPTGSLEELIARAKAAAPPATTGASSGERRPFDLVDLRAAVPNLELDVRYATDDNFLGRPVYAAPVAMLQRPAAAALRDVAEELEREGLGLLVFDAYRPWWVTKAFWDATPSHQREFVADPRSGSRHNRGCAVDLSLYDLATGEVIEMPSGYDEFTPRASPDYPGGTCRQRYFRERLRRAMLAHGFEPYHCEWWHFDFADWQAYPVGNEGFRRAAPALPPAPAGRGRLGAS